MVQERKIRLEVEETHRDVGERIGGVTMLQIPTIDWMARLRQKEMDRDRLGLSIKGRSLSWVNSARKAHLDLNIRLVLQPRLSLSIWLGRGV